MFSMTWATQAAENSFAPMLWSYAIIKDVMDLWRQFDCVWFFAAWKLCWRPFGEAFMMHCWVQNKNEEKNTRLILPQPTIVWCVYRDILLSSVGLFLSTMNHIRNQLQNTHTYIIHSLLIWLGTVQRFRSVDLFRSTAETAPIVRCVSANTCEHL